MKKICTSALLLLLSLFSGKLATAQSTSLAVQKYMTDTAFTCIAVSESGYVYAGTNGRGMVRYDSHSWKLWNGLFSSISKGNIRQIAISNDSVWIAHSGYVFYLGFPEAGNNNNLLGGIHLMGKNNNLAKLYYRGRPVLGQQNPNNQGPPTRNILGVAIDANGKPWCAASYHDSVTYPAITNYNARYHFAPGAVGRYNGSNFDFITGPALPDPTEILIGVGNNYRDESYSIGKRRTIRTVTRVGNEMWAATDGYDQATGNTITAGILRYDLAGNYLGKYDQNNTPVPFGLTNSSQAPWAMYQDAIGRVWVGMNSTRGIAVLDTNGVWTHVGLPSMLNGGQVRAHAIAGNSRGEVFFGTNSGLLVYKGNGSFVSDTSYTLYTTANGLSSNTIQGVAVSKDENIWLATAAGINKVSRGDLYVYNRKPFATIFTDQDVFRTPVLHYNSKAPQQYIDKDTLLIAADGGRATIFKWTGASPQNVRMRFVENINGQNVNEFGSFSVRHQDTDSVRYLYSHPKYVDDLYILSGGGRNVRLQILDSTQNPELVMLDVPVKFVLPPVLMIHGVWSSTKAFQQMEDYLKSSLNGYKPFSLLRIWYGDDNHPEPARSQEFYKYEVPDGITKLMENCANNKMSAGRADILGHSRGAIFARIYLQEKYVRYRNDINKLISLNTPHSGSQTANLVLDKRKIPIYLATAPGLPPHLDTSISVGNVFGFFTLEDVDDINGALELKVNAPAITQDLNGPGNLNKNTTYSHAFVGRHVFGQSGFANVLNSGFFAGSPSFSMRFAAMLLSGTINSADNLMMAIFNGEYNDVVVPESSQQGGLAEQYTSKFPGINVAHSTKKLAGFIQTTTSVIETPQVHTRVAELLRQRPDGGSFATDGFNPVNLSNAYTFLLPNPPYITGSVERDPSIPVVTIDPAVRNATFLSGDTVSIKVATEGPDTLLIKYSGRTIGVFSDVKFGNDTTFRFPIPAEATGAVKIEVFGFEAAKIAYDSTSINIGIPPSAVLDSIKIAHAHIDDLKIVINDSTHIKVMGYYSDNVVRELTYESSLSSSRLTNAVGTQVQGYVKGLVLGFDELKVTYGGKADSVSIEVIPRAVYDTVPGVVLPVRFVKIGARYNGKDVDVTWQTSMEQNNSYFEVEHSVDGVNFFPAGKINATNYPNGSSYAFVHSGFVTGNNYYRIKQVDIDSRFSRSEIAIAVVKVNSNIAIYPNPADALLTVDFSRNPQHKAKQLRISNTIGQVLIQQNVTAAAAKTFVVLAELPAGIYTIEVLDNAGKRILSERIIKNK